MSDSQYRDQHQLYALQRRVDRMDAGFRIILGGALITAVVGVLTWAPVAMSEPDASNPPEESPWNILHKFTADTPAVADDVNFNFETVYDRTVVNEAGIATNALDIAANAQGIADLGTSSIDGSRIQNATITANKLVDGAVNAQVKNYILNNCYIYMGWRDTCNGCDIAPSTWVRKKIGNTGNGCNGGAGEKTCRDGWAGIGTGGTVNGDDLFYVKFHCE